MSDIRIGIQSSVMGWDDPWHQEACKSNMRTGEGMWFPSQDPAPSKEELIRFIRSFGADFYMHCVMPDEREISEFLRDAQAAGLDVMLNNEFGCINGPFAEGSNRYDIPERNVAEAVRAGHLLGLVYDETEHLQLHPNQYVQKLPHETVHGTRHQWAATAGKTLQQIEDDVESAVRRRVEAYGNQTPLYSEQVFPVMYHTLARGGMHPCPKVLKEEFQSVQLATALGAAAQYDRRLGICVDLWGLDVGAWFTRVWGFPAHSPREYQSALELAYAYSPNLMYTENIDALGVNGPNGFRKTEFGDTFERFIREYVPANKPLYSHADAVADIAVIRSDDTDWGPDKGLYGSDTIRSDEHTRSPFDVFHLLSNGSLPREGITFFLPRFDFPVARYPRTDAELGQLPLARGVEREAQTSVHGLFYPMNNVLVFDERAGARELREAKLIFLAGKRMTDSCLQAVSARVRQGALCIAASWLLPDTMRAGGKDGEGRWIITDDFLGDDVREAVRPYIGSSRIWSQRFGDYEARFSNPSGDGITLEHEICRLTRI